MTRRDFIRLSVVAWRPSAAPGVARVDRSLCIAWAEGPCRMCETKCPLAGTALRWEGGPVIDAGACDGCGKCVDACVAVNVPPAMTIGPG